MLRRIPVLLLLLALTPRPAAAQTAALELIPSDATLGIGIRSLDDVSKKGDAFVKDAGIDLPLRPSQLFDQLFMVLGVQGVVDGSGPAAIMLVSEKAVGQALGLNSLEQYIVVTLSFKDLDKVADKLGVKADALKPGKVAKVQGAAFLDRAAVKGKQLYLGKNEKAVQSVVEGKSVHGELLDARRQRLARADVVVHVGTQAWGEGWKTFLGEIDRGFAGLQGEAEREAAKLFSSAMAELRFAVGAITLDKGFGVSVVTVFPKDGEASKKFLTLLRGGDGAAALNGLPADNVVAALAAKGDGSKNGPIARALFHWVLNGFLTPGKVISPLNRDLFTGLFGHLWERLRGSRLALYRTGDEPRLGLFGMVAIVDTEDPKKFLAELKQLAKLGHGEGLDLKNDPEKETTQAELEQMIKDLGDRRFRVREAAATRLELAGEAALPYLEKALESKDAEVKKRAEQLKSQIVQVAEQRRKDLLSKDPVWLVKPSFRFEGKGESVGGTAVEVATVSLRKKDADTVPHLRQLLGPQWNKVRFAVHDKQVVVLAGSDVKLLETTLANLKGDKPGLGGSPHLAGFGKHADPGRKMEFHVSMQLSAALARAADLETPAKVKVTPDLSSFGLTVDPDRMQLDVFVPLAEFKQMAKPPGDQ